MRRALLLALLVIAPAALAMPANTSLRGRVMSAGQPVASATVTATSKSLQHPRTTTTGASGTYWLAALPPGDYEVTFSSPRMQTLTRRVVVELARVARADATLEPSEDEETVTSTATTIGVSDTIEVTTHRTAETLQRFPVYGDADSVLYAAPGPVLGTPPISIDGTTISNVPAEALDEATLTLLPRAGEGARSADEGVIHARTRTGGEELSLAARATISNRSEDVFETAAGGRIVPERLWFFAAADSAERGVAKLTGQLGALHNLTAAYYRNDGESTAALAHTGAWSARLTTETLAARDSVSARATYVAGDHIFTAGAASDDDGRAFLGDRWILPRWTLSGTLGYESELTWQAAATYDLPGDGRRAFIASASDDASTLGFAAAIGSAGIARVDAIHRDAYDSLQVDWSYRLLDRFGAGANYAWTDFSSRELHNANAWLTADIPIGPHLFTATVVQRFVSAGTPDSPGATDLAIRYSVPIARTTLTLAADVENAFNEPLENARGPRTVRFWVRLGL